MKTSISHACLRTLAFTLLLVLTSCSKVDHPLTIVESGDNETPLRYQGEDECYEVPFDPTGQDPTILAYEYLKFHHGFVSPEYAFPEPLRQRFVDRMDYATITYGGKTLMQFLQDLLSEGLIDSFAKAKFEELDQRLQNPEDISQTISWLSSVIQDTRNSTTETCLGRYLVLSVFQSYFQSLRYFEEISVRYGYFQGGASNLAFRSSSCNFWTQLACVFNFETLKYAIIGALVGCSIESILEGGYGDISGFVEFTSSSLQILLSCITSGITSNALGIGIGATVGLLYGIVMQWDDCACVDCGGIKTMAYRFRDCTPIADFRPRGYGSDIVEFAWDNEFGTPNQAITTAVNPGLRISDISGPSEMLEVMVQPICEDPNENPEVFTETYDLESEYLEPRSLVLTGPTMLNDVQAEMEVTYYVTGAEWLNISRYSWDYWVWNGTIVSSTSSSVTIRWDCALDEGEVGINFWIDCPGGQANTRSYTLDVVFMGDMF